MKPQIIEILMALLEVAALIFQLFVFYQNLLVNIPDQAFWLVIYERSCLRNLKLPARLSVRVGRNGLPFELIVFFQDFLVL